MQHLVVDVELAHFGVNLFSVLLLQGGLLVLLHDGLANLRNARGLDVLWKLEGGLLHTSLSCHVLPLAVPMARHSACVPVRLQVHQESWICSCCIPHLHDIGSFHQGLQLCHRDLPSQSSLLLGQLHLVELLITVIGFIHKRCLGLVALSGLILIAIVIIVILFLALLAWHDVLEALLDCIKAFELLFHSPENLRSLPLNFHFILLVGFRALAFGLDLAACLALSFCSLRILLRLLFLDLLLLFLQLFLLLRTALPHLRLMVLLLGLLLAIRLLRLLRCFCCLGLFLLRLLGLCSASLHATSSVLEKDPQPSGVANG
mmetsp:Transcript_58186/g.138549  ORF Transcript_58186/g.138549 Transcript_58186/m.138549 type:complete len:317 (-) Transcript_58186:79-1029(-)